MRLATIFHDHAVLQRDLPLPVWGWAAADQTVTVTLAGQRAQTTAAADGSWMVRLAPLPAGGPHRLTAEAGGTTVVAEDVLIGEVWVCSGQSNMEWKLASTDPDIAGADLSRIRLLTVATAARSGRTPEVDGRWMVCSPGALAAFSAAGSWFGRELHAKLGVPVGLICNAWGGTRVQAWMSREALMQDPLGRDEVRHYEAFAFAPAPDEPGTFTSMRDWEQRGAPKDAGNRGLVEGWAAADHADTAWATMPVPSRWQDHGHLGSGVFWFRRSVTVPATWAGRELELRIGAVDKHDDTYVNGTRVGGLSWDAGPNSWCTPRAYRVPGHLVGADGRLVIAVRARSHAFHGGMIGPAIELGVAPLGEPDSAVPLHGQWRYRIEQDWGVVTPPAMPWGGGNQNSPFILFDSRLAPLIPFALRGVIWYQGESNAHEPEHYRRLLPLMIRDWRRAWGQGDFPFLQVQLANFGVPSASPAHGRWAELRDAQVATLAEPATGMAVTIDIGDAKDIHPHDKRSVGKRLAALALAETYGQDVVPSGPLFSGAVIEAGARMRLRFAHARGLRTRDGRAVSHLEMAGHDRVFHPAQGVIEGETVIVSCAKVAKPAAVRYAWADNPEGCNLVNGADLPASPLRTDGW